jgi:hypothetical protein
MFQISLTKFPRLAQQKPDKVQINRAALPLAVMFAALYLFLFILPSIETESDEHQENALHFSYLSDVFNYVVNLVQILMIVMVMFLVFYVYNLFGCTKIGYPLVFTVLFVMAMMSFMFLLRAAFKCIKAWFDIDRSVLTATICVPLICLLPVFVFNHISQPSIKSLEIYFPINAFLLGVDLFQDYLNTGKLNPSSCEAI